MTLSLELLRGNVEFQGYIKHSRSALIGEPNRQWGDSGGVEDYLGELAEYCLDLDEVSCYRMSFRMANFGHFKNLRKLNLSSSIIRLAHWKATPTVPALSITSLFIHDCALRDRLDPAYLPAVRSLTVSVDGGIPFGKMHPLLPQINLLRFATRSPDFVDLLLARSTALKILSLSLRNLRGFNLDTRAIIQERIEELRISVDYSPIHDELTVANAIISGSRVMKKVIVDGSDASSYWSTVYKTMNILVPVCKKAEVDLWKENFEAGNGKVDLDSK